MKNKAKEEFNRARRLYRVAVRLGLEENFGESNRVMRRAFLLARGIGVPLHRLREAPPRDSDQPFRGSLSQRLKAFKATVGSVNPVGTILDLYDAGFAEAAYDRIFDTPELEAELVRDDLTAAEMIERLQARNRRAA